MDQRLIHAIMNHLSETMGTVEGAKGATYSQQVWMEIGLLDLQTKLRGNHLLNPIGTPDIKASIGLDNLGALHRAVEPTPTPVPVANTVSAPIEVPKVVLEPVLEDTQPEPKAPDTQILDDIDEPEIEESLLEEELPVEILWQGVISQMSSLDRGIFKKTTLQIEGTRGVISVGSEGLKDLAEKKLKVVQNAFAASGFEDKIKSIVVVVKS
jgi:hypothetical protein